MPHRTHDLTRDEVSHLEGAAQALLRDRGHDIINAIDDGIYCLDTQGLTLFVNEAAARVLGYGSRELLGKSMHALVHHHHEDGSPFPEAECPISASVTEGVQQRVGLDVFWHKDGHPVPVDYTSIPIREGRRILGAVVTFRDISVQAEAREEAAQLAAERAALKEAERARASLAASEARFRFLAEAIPVQIWTARPDGMLDYVSQRTADYFGRSAEQILRDGWRDVVHPDDLADVGALWVNALSTGEPYEVEFRLRAADGSYRWHLGRAIAQRDAEGRIVHWFGTNTDVQEQRQAELGASDPLAARRAAPLSG
ncbi:MAG TPA: PAS domain S-box protein [Gemmatimonadaceae bacterium]